MSVQVPARAGESRDRTWETRRMGRSLLLSEADLAALNAMRPRCARCDKPVESLSWTLVPPGMSVAFRAGCHGAVEETTVALADMHVLLGHGVQGAEAFREPNLLENKT